MNKAMTVISGLGAGAGLMYFLDPDRGKRRRAEVRDKARHLATKTNDMAGKTSRDLANRVTGVIAETRSLFLCREVSDEVLVARVRSRLGRVVSHPSAIKVAVTAGLVTLSGPILASEVDHLLKSVATVRGVAGVENRLDVHDQPEGVSGLQDGRVSPGQRGALMQLNWSPTTRLVAGAVGGALMAYAAKRRGLPGLALAPVGLGMLSRAVTNLETGRLIGIKTGPRTIDIEKTINFAAPIEEVFDFWSHHERFPQFMSNVRDVRKIDEGRYHWVVAGPAGISVEWDAEITRVEPNRLIAFESLPGSAIEQKGTVRFTATSEGDTSVDIKMSYNPPAGALGHLVAVVFGADPKREMDADLMRMKSFIETGQAPHDAAQKKSMTTGGNS